MFYIFLIAYATLIRMPLKADYASTINCKKCNEFPQKFKPVPAM